MTEQELEIITKYANLTERYNKRMFITTMALILAVVLVFTISMCVVSSMSRRSNQMSVDYWHEYLSTDYDYGTITQTTEVNTK